MTVARAARASRVWIPPAVVEEQCEDEQHVLLWQVRGDADLVVEGVAQTLTLGHAIWIPVGTRHAFTVRASSVTMPTFFEAASVATSLREPTTVTVDRDLRTLLLAYVVASTTIVRPGIDLTRQILAMVEGSPARPTSLPTPTSSAAGAIAEALRSNPGDARGVDELAASVHASARSIERAYRAETGMTLRTWRIRTRVEAAAALLRDDTTVEAVASRVGYSNARAFARVFVTHMGMTPAAYARRYRVG